MSVILLSLITNFASCAIKITEVTLTPCRLPERPNFINLMLECYIQTRKRSIFYNWGLIFEILVLVQLILSLTSRKSETSQLEGDLTPEVVSLLIIWRYLISTSAGPNPVQGLSQNLHNSILLTDPNGKTYSTEILQPQEVELGERRASIGCCYS